MIDKIIPLKTKQKFTAYKACKTVEGVYKTFDIIDRAFIKALVPTVFKPLFGGKYMYADGVYMQMISIGDPSPINPNRQGIPPRKDLRLIDDLLDIPVNENACIAITQTAIPLPAKDESEALESARRENILAASLQESEQEGVFKNVHDKIIDYIAEGINEYNRAVFEGRLRMFEFSLILAVKGRTKKDVDDLMSLIISLLDGKRVIHEIIEYGQADAYDMMMPTPFIKERLLSTTTGEMVAMTSPLRNKNPRLAKSGHWLGLNEDTNNPVFLNFHDGSLISGHAIVVGKSGTGKSTELLKDDKRAIEEGDEALHIVPKADEGTDHIRVCRALKGQLIKIGHKRAAGQEEDSNPNIFQIFFDPERMENTIGAYQLAYSKHVAVLPDIIGLLIGHSFSDPQRNWAYNSVVELYNKFKIIDDNGDVINTEKWEDGLIWPTLEDWRDMLFIWMTQSELHKAPQVNSVIAALYNNTSMITKKGPYGFLINKNSVKLKKKYTMVDLSELIDAPNIQDAMILYITSLINTKIQCVPQGVEKKHIFITIDEGANLVKIPRMRKVIERMFRELRSFGGHLKIVFQDLAGIPASMINMMKTNTDYVLLFSNMGAYNIKPLVKEFNLTPKDIRRLKATGKGRGLLIIGDTHLNYFNSLTDDDKRILFGKEALEEDVIIERAPLMSIDSRVEWVKKTHRIFVKDWMNGIDKFSTVEVPGYEIEQFYHPFAGVLKTAYVEVGLEKEDGHIKNQTKEHYLFTYSLGGEICLLDSPHIKSIKVTGDDYGTDQEADLKVKVELTAGGVFTMGIEIEMPKTHTAEELQKKRDRLLMKKHDGAPVYDTVLFTAAGEYYKTMLRDAVGAQFAAQRGTNLKTKILKLIQAADLAAGSENETSPETE